MNETKTANTLNEVPEVEKQNENENENLPAHDIHFVYTLLIKHRYFIWIKLLIFNEVVVGNI